MVDGIGAGFAEVWFHKLTVRDLSYRTRSLP